MSLTLIIGCMFSGKTTELVHVVERYLAIDRKVLVINHSFDKSRSGDGVLQTHSGKHLGCVYSDSLHFGLVEGYDVVAVNEAQFFDNLEDSVNAMLDAGKELIVCGLDSDFKREPFQNILSLVPHATRLIKTTAFCKLCANGTPALFSKRTAQSDERVLIGNEDSYVPVCRKCYG